MPKTIAGSGLVDIDCCLYPMSIFGSCAKANGTTITVALQGDNCDCECSIGVVASPALTAGVVINPTASANLAASIAVTVNGGGSAIASGSVALNDDGGTLVVTPLSIPVPIPAGSASKTFAATAMPPLNATISGCATSITIATAASLDLTAETTFFDWHGMATGRIGKATPGLTITPTTSCPNVPPLTPILIDYPGDPNG